MWGGSGVSQPTRLLDGSARTPRRASGLRLCCNAAPSICPLRPLPIRRHPFYLSFLLAAMSGTLIAGEPLLLLTAVVLLGFYVSAAKSEEASFRETPFAEDYESYRSQTGMFLPAPLRRRKAKPSSRGLAWRRIWWQTPT